MTHTHRHQVHTFQLINKNESVDKVAYKEDSSTVTRLVLNVLRALGYPYRLFLYRKLLLVLVLKLP
jgi:hypothetical protein